MAESTSDDQFKILQREIRESIRRNYPNPDRIGCPGSETLRRMAESTLPPRDAAYKHVMECSPCYEELMEFSLAVESRKSREKERSRRRVIASTIAVAVVIAGVVFYFVSRPTPLKPPRSPNQVADGSAKQSSPKTVPGDRLSVAMLNLDSETSIRSTGGQRRTTELQRLPRTRLDLTVNLPRGLETGPYELVFSRDDGPPLLRLTGQARIEDGLTVLHVQPDLSGLAPGPYNLRIRRDGSAWREAQILLF
jgi:hypothetical protein